MNGSVAFHLIDRHSNGWGDVSTMMHAWLRANGGVMPNAKVSGAGTASTELPGYTAGGKRQMKAAYADLIVGTAAEYLVCADLLLGGYSAFRADQACAYDVTVDMGAHLIRVQVKATRQPRPYPQASQKHITGYTWNCRHGKGAVRGYSSTAFDVLALVALDTRQIAYIPSSNVRQTIQIPVSGMLRKPRRNGFDGLTFATAICQPLLEVAK